MVSWLEERATAFTTVPSFRRITSSAATCGSRRARMAETVVIFGRAAGSSETSDVWAQIGETIESGKATSQKTKDWGLILKCLQEFLSGRRVARTESRVIV